MLSRKAQSDPFTFFSLVKANTLLKDAFKISFFFLLVTFTQHPSK